jgi:hypothetical protein
MNFDIAVIFDETELAKPVHEEADPRSGGADQIRQRFLADFVGLISANLLSENVFPACNACSSAYHAQSDDKIREHSQFHPALTADITSGSGAFDLFFSEIVGDEEHILARMSREWGASFPCRPRSFTPVALKGGMHFSRTQRPRHS